MKPGRAALTRVVGSALALSGVISPAICVGKPVAGTASLHARTCRSAVGRGQLPTTIDAEALARVVSTGDGCWKLVNFWATWCAPCRAEVPRLAALQSDRRFRRLRIITVDLDEAALRPAAARFLALAKARRTLNFQLTPPDLDAVRGIVGGRFTMALPLTLIVGPDGQRILRHDGVLNVDRLAAYLLDQGS